MTSQEIRKKFLDFFAAKGHKIVPSSSLLPKDDTSVLLTTAGMQQFKPYYTGAKDPIKDFGSRRTASIQKSFRTSDIDEVGDESHLTFFEMLGNFSFGDYFKEDAIKWGWEFITKEMGIAPERCHVSVFRGDSEVPEDEESIEIWKSLGLADDKIKKCGREDNFWGPTGTEGPCGPTSEIYVDGIEIWNLVFNQYYMRADKKLELLKQNGIDTGMGLERLAMIMQNKKTIFETDLFRPIFDEYLISGHVFRGNFGRIISDHLRSSVFLLADGIKPSNKEAGYILRRLLRRIIVRNKKFGFDEKFIEIKINSIINYYGNFYPELIREKSTILTEFEKEANKFNQTLELGLREFYKKYPEMKAQILKAPAKNYEIYERKFISGKNAFDLYQTFGFPPEVIKDLAGDGGHIFNESEFNEEFKKHQEISRAGAEKKFGGHGIGGEKSGDNHLEINPEDAKKITRLHTALHLLHQAIHDVLDKEGVEVKQMGSDITPERGRFDFTFPRKLTPEEIKEIENIVNEEIKLDLPVTMKKMAKEEAVRLGARAFFRDKYPDEVNVYSIGDADPSKAYSKELCGGPHVGRTGEIGQFKITKEESSSAGIRRIRVAVE